MERLLKRLFPKPGAWHRRAVPSVRMARSYFGQSLSYLQAVFFFFLLFFFFISYFLFFFYFFYNADFGSKMELLRRQHPQYSNRDRLTTLSSRRRAQTTESQVLSARLAHRTGLLLWSLDLAGERRNQNMESISRFTPDGKHRSTSGR
jgi:hypothetical protein